MRVTFHGVRGSCPTPGPSTVRYGGNTVCVEVRSLDGALIVLDAGTGLRELGKQLIRSPLPAPIHTFITHGHWDHILGAPFFAPMFRKDAHIILHAMSERSAKLLHRNVLFDGDHFPVRVEDIPARVDRAPMIETEVRCGSATVRRIRLNHPGGCDGYRVDDADGTSLCYLTDNELAPPGPLVTTPAELARFAAGTSLLIHDAQYIAADLPDKHGWGHSLVDQVLELGRSAEARMLALHHHDPDRDDAALDAIGRDALAWTRAHAPSMGCVVAAEGLSLDLKP